VFAVEDLCDLIGLGQREESGGHVVGSHQGKNLADPYGWVSLFYAGHCLLVQPAPFAGYGLGVATSSASSGKLFAKRHEGCGCFVGKDG